MEQRLHLPITIQNLTGPDHLNLISHGQESILASSDSLRIAYTLDILDDVRRQMERGSVVFIQQARQLRVQRG